MANSLGCYWDRQHLCRLGLCGLQDPRSGGEAQAHGVRDLAQALALLAQAPHLVPIEHQPRTAAHPALLAGALQAGNSALADLQPFLPFWTFRSSLEGQGKMLLQDSIRRKMRMKLGPVLVA